MTSADTHTIGILSGTSMDAIDVALVAHHGQRRTLIDTHTHAIPTPLKKTLQRLCQPGDNEINLLGACDTELGHVFAQAINTLLHKHPGCKVSAIGSHGQTIRHHPDITWPFSLQVGNPLIIAKETGITTIADFRKHDMAHGGQGAPLAPIFHQHVFWQDQQPTAVVNIGGMANITLLDGHNQSASMGFDTGPGNCLMDAWIKQHQDKAFDQDGAWASSGQLIPELLTACLAHPFFKQPPPKSTGHEDFHLAWLTPLITAHSKAEDVQRTLLELTAQSIADGISASTMTIEELIVCGGGANNSALCTRLAELLGPCKVMNSESRGIAADWVEAVLFAWLAHQHQQGRALDMRHVTGAKNPLILGVAYQA